MRTLARTFALGLVIALGACRAKENSGATSDPSATEAGAGGAAPTSTNDADHAGATGAAPDGLGEAGAALGADGSAAAGADAASIGARLDAASAADARTGDPLDAAESGGAVPADATVVLFFIDGLQAASLRTAIAAGAPNLKFVVEQGVTAETSYATSPAARLVVPPAAQPWGNATSGNVAAHTGCHLNESSEMDDIFLAARRAGIRSVFAGSDANYAIFTTPDFHYAGGFSDAEVLQHALDHLNADHTRLLRLHFQRIRDFWTGPASSTDPSSAYIGHLREVDGLLGQLIAALKSNGVWERTYLVLASDHGMGQAPASDHPPSTTSSWRNFMAFYGPGIKKGTAIPYAELPDVAILTTHLLGLGPLGGHAATVAIARRAPTGTLLTNLFEGAPPDIAHPRYIETYLSAGTFTSSGDEYAPYRTAMLRVLQQ